MGTFAGNRWADPKQMVSSVIRFFLCSFLFLFLTNGESIAVV